VPWEERRQLAYSIVPRAVNEVIGPEGIDWHSAKAPRPDGSAITTWILPGKGTSELTTSIAGLVGSGISKVIGETQESWKRLLRLPGSSMMPWLSSPLCPI